MSNGLREYRSTGTYSTLAISGVGLVGFLHIPAVAVGFVQIIDPNRSFGSEHQLSLWLVLQSLFALLQFLAFVGAAVVFLMWLHRSSSNLPALRSENVDFTPGWTVGWWFIPLANLVKPFQAVRNVWSESDPNVDTSHAFLSSVQAGAPGFMVAWWAFWILANIVSNVTSKIFDPADMRTTELSGYFFTIDGLLWIAAAVFAIKVIRSITQRQEERYMRVGTVVPLMPPPPPTFGDNT